MRLIWRILGVVTILLAWVGAGALAVGLADRQPPIAYESVRAMSASVPQGGSIEVEFRVFRTRICPATARRWLTDSAGVKHSIPSYTVGPRVELAGLDTYRRSITIPDAAATGQASYQVDLIYECNIFHRLGWPILVSSPPIRFDVTQPLILLPPLAPPPDADG